MVSQDILVPTDFGQGSRAGLEHALDSLGSADGRVSVLHIIDQRFMEQTLSLFPDEQRSTLLARLREQAQKQYAELIKGLAIGNVDMALICVEGLPFLKIVQLARELAVDMIVMTAHRGPANFEKFLFGSTAERVLRMAPCPVLIVPETVSSPEA
ncbi:hypothetical protein NKDENANG_01514 [Candidatus Entotheonellaceae bacterium PAL068K]